MVPLSVSARSEGLSTATWPKRPRPCAALPATAPPLVCGLVRIPHSFVNDGHRGYLEDRRPNSMADPYRITGRIVQTIQSVTAQALIEDAFAA